MSDTGATRDRVLGVSRGLSSSFMKEVLRGYYQSYDSYPYPCLISLLISVAEILLSAYLISLERSFMPQYR